MTVFFSEYVEGSSFNKALEIYNGTGTPINLATEGYTLELYSNGNASPNATLALTGAIAPGDVFVLAHPSADATILAAADVTNGAVINFNGDDTVVLRKNGAVVDVFGQIGFDPGTSWPGGGADVTLRRLPSVTTGDTDGNNAFNAATEWASFPQNTFDGLGSHGAPPPPPPPETTRIHTIQGNGNVTPLNGQAVTVEAIVVGDFQGSNGLRGFYLQEENADVDTDATTSEGIFVFDGALPAVDVQVGDKVRVTGTAGEFSGQTQLSNLTQVSVISSGNPLPTAAEVRFPLVNGSADLEATEGMLVTIPDTLLVTEYFNLDRFGEIRLASDGPGNVAGTDGRLDQYTQFNTPSVSGFAAYQVDLDKRQLVLDDGSNVQNPNTLIFGRGGQPLSQTNTLRGGDSITGLTGVLGFGFGDYRLQTNQGVNFQAVNERPATPTDVGGNLKVASFNVLNYFTTLDDAISGNNNPLTDAGLEPRGANDLTPSINPSTAEFDRQTAKLVTTLLTMDADVLGLVELENSNTDSALANLVAELNAVAGAGTYDFIRNGGLVGTDAITVGFIYKATAVNPVGNLAILDSAAFTDPNGTGLQRNRPALAQTFKDAATGATFTAVANHFKSKGDSGLAGNPSISPTDVDANDGQGFWNDTRTKAAIALANWLATDPTGSGDTDVLILGDLNSYASEDPIRALTTAGYTDLAQQLLGNAAYSYVFDGQLGTLDYALANQPLVTQVTGITEWHINADEPDALDYNLNFGRDPSLFDGTTPYRTADHDPVLVGLNLLPEIRGTNGRNTLTGTARNEQIFGYGGNDTIAGGLGNDQIFGGDGDDVLRGDLNNRSSGSAADGNDLIFGGSGNDRIGGKSGDDILYGDAGDDQIWGDAGDDLIYGGLGNDTVFGGQGVDTFVLAVGTGIDAIQDFEVGTDFIGLANGLSFGDLTRSGNALTVGGEVLAVLTGVDTTMLTADSFVVV